MLSFEILHPPTVQKQTRFFRRGDSFRAYDPSKADKEFIQEQIRPFAPETLFTGPVSLSLVFFRAIPKSTSAKRRKMMVDYKILPTTRPDIDNYAYLVTNALTGIVYEDDSLVCTLICHKFYSERPRTHIFVQEI